MNEVMKHCPFCGESVLEVAIKCKHCGSSLDLQVGTTIAIRSADYGVALLAIPVVSTLLLWFWVSGMNLMQYPGDTMALIMLMTILSTAFVASMETGKGIPTKAGQGSNGATTWFFAIALIWIIAYPLYLFKRRKFGLPNRGVLGLLIAIVFVGSFGVMEYALESKKAEVRENIGQIKKQLDLLGK